MNAIEKATQAINAMYDNYETRGGVSPDTRDESRVVAEALGVETLTWHDHDAVLTEIWERSCDGIPVEEIAALHVAALRNAGRTIS